MKILVYKCADENCEECSYDSIWLETGALCSTCKEGYILSDGACDKERIVDNTGYPMATQIIATVTTLFSLSFLTGS